MLLYRKLWKIYPLPTLHLLRPFYLIYEKCLPQAKSCCDSRRNQTRRTNGSYSWCFSFGISYIVWRKDLCVIVALPIFTKIPVWVSIVFFYEAICALLIDKDRRPKSNHKTVDEIDMQQIHYLYFKEKNFKGKKNLKWHVDDSHQQKLWNSTYVTTTGWKCWILCAQRTVCL